MIILEDITISIVNFRNKNILTQTTNLQTMNFQTMTRYIKNHIKLNKTIKLNGTKQSEAISNTENLDNKTFFEYHLCSNTLPCSFHKSPTQYF